MWGAGRSPVVNRSKGGQTVSKKKDRTPDEIVAVRRQRENRRVVCTVVIWLIWAALFGVAFVLDSVALMAVAFALSMINVVVFGGLVTPVPCTSG